MCLIAGTSPAIAAASGYTQLDSSGIDGNVNINTGVTASVSSVEMTIANHAFTNTLSDGTVQTRMRKITVPASGTTDLSNQVLLLPITYDGDMQADFDDIRVTNAAGTVLQQKYGTVVNSASAQVYVQVPTVYASQTQTLYMTYGSASAARYSVSGLVIPSYSDSVQTSSTATQYSNTGYTLARTFTHTTTSEKKLKPYKFTFQYRAGTVANRVMDYYMTVTPNGGSETTVATGQVSTSSTSYSTKTQTYSTLVEGTAGQTVVVKFYLKVNAASMYMDEATSYAYVLPALILTYDASNEYILQPNYTITATVNGVEHYGVIAYNGQDLLTYTPNAVVSQISVVSNSWNWDYSTKLYWGEDTAVHTESVSLPYAVMSIAYTPSAPIASGSITTTYSLTNFSQSYSVGNPIVTIDGVSKTGTRDGQTVTIPFTSMSAAAHTIVVQVPFDSPPVQLSPANGYEYSYYFPPLMHDIDLSWTSTGAAGYTYQVATDQYFVNIIASGTPIANSTTISVPRGTYHWRVRGYNGITGLDSPYSPVRTFTIDETVYSFGTAINGVVYLFNTNQPIVIPEAMVFIYNNTWSDQYMTGDAGYYVFYNLAPASTYYIQVSKDGYTTTTAVATTVNDQTLQMNVILEQETSPTYIMPHKVKFVLTNLISKFPDVPVSVYRDGVASPLYTGTTGSDGSITFDLAEDEKYRVRFLDPVRGIDRTWTGYPSDTVIYVITLARSGMPEPRLSDDILFGAYGTPINLTTGYVNVSYNDTSGTTTSAEMWLYDSNETQLYHATSAESTGNWSYIVPASNQTYIVKFTLMNTLLDEPKTAIRTIAFNQEVRFNLGFDDGWNYILLACAIITIVACIFSRLDAHIGAVALILTAWGMFGATGWLVAGLSMAKYITVGLMLMLGTVLAFGAALQKGEDDIS